MVGAMSFSEEKKAASFKDEKKRGEAR